MTAASALVMCAAIQSDGQRIFGGTGSTALVGGIARYSTANVRDTTFATNTGTGCGTAIVNALAIQSDGKILVGGTYTTWNGTASIGRLVRLNSTGAIDAAYTTNNGTGANGSIFSLAIQSDGKCVVVGNFTLWNGTAVNYFVRLNTDGTRDATYTVAAPVGVRKLVMQSDNKVVVTGNFTNWGGVTVKGLVRLNTNGTLDTTFNANVNLTSTGITNFFSPYDGVDKHPTEPSIFSTSSTFVIQKIGGEAAV